jgi:hypothetical protein
MLHRRQVFGLTVLQLWTRDAVLPTVPRCDPKSIEKYSVIFKMQSMKANCKLQGKVIHKQTQEVVASVCAFMKMKVDAGFAANRRKTQKRVDRNTGKSVRRTAKDMIINVPSVCRLSFLSSSM